jgi:hypothetical protein
VVRLVRRFMLTTNSFIRASILLQYADSLKIRLSFSK